MNRSEYMAIKPQFLSKYAGKYDAYFKSIKPEAGNLEYFMKKNLEDINDQYPYVLKINGDTAYINLYGPMSENGPDWIDIALGYYGIAYKNLIRAAEEILKNDAIKQVYINSNTPGGNIDGLEEATKSLEYLAQKRPVIALNRGMIASAGVWYTSAAQKIIASNNDSMIGSIGVVLDTLDFTGYYNSFGIEQIIITNSDSPNKRPDLLTKEGKAIYTKELDALYGVFLDRVTTGLSVNPESIKALKGEMIIASEAVKIGLMDGIEGIAASTANNPGSNTVAKTEIQTKELKMEADVKEALDSIAGSVTALASQVATIATEKAPEAEAKKELSKEDKKFSLNIITGNAYPATVTAEAGKVLAGDSDISTLKAMTAAVDAVKEQTAGAAVGAGENTETVPTGEMPGGDKKKEANGELNDEASIKAELERIGEV